MVAWPALRERCARFGITLLEQECRVFEGADGRRVRFFGTIRWPDFDLFGPARRERAMRSAEYFMALMGSTRGGVAFDPALTREAGLECRAWLEAALSGTRADANDGSHVDATVVITHFGPSVRSADPRYGRQSSTASFCNADDDLLPLADLWLHGHLHCRHDYLVDRRDGGRARVVCNARGAADKGESDGHVPLLVLSV